VPFLFSFFTFLAQATRLGLFSPPPAIGHRRANPLFQFPFSFQALVGGLLCLLFWFTKSFNSYASSFPFVFGQSSFPLFFSLSPKHDAAFSSVFPPPPYNRIFTERFPSTSPKSHLMSSGRLTYSSPLSLLFVPLAREASVFLLASFFFDLFSFEPWRYVLEEQTAFSPFYPL